MGFERRSEKFANFARTALTALAIASPFTFAARVESVAPRIDGYNDIGYFSSYYCYQEAGYPIYDGGNFCGLAADGNRPVEGLSAACGSDFPLGATIYFNLGYGDESRICTDRGFGRRNQVELFTETNAGIYRYQKQFGFPTTYPIFVVLP